MNVFRFRYFGLKTPIHALSDAHTHARTYAKGLYYLSPAICYSYGADHRLRGSASPVLTATGFVNGKGQFSTPHRIDTPQPITKKFVTGDYVGDPYGCAKLGAYPYTGGFWAHG